MLLTFTVALTIQVVDNSFLLEEAFNQERRVVQHIATFSRARRGGEWIASLTSEWPLRGQRHQLSYTGTLLRTAGPMPSTGLGDLAINYRWQATGREGSRLWIAPRATVLLPTGNADRGRGSGGVGVEMALPVSLLLRRGLTTHLNGGLLINPGARGRGRLGVETRTARLGGSVIADLTPKVNVLVETLWRSSREVGPAGTTIGVRHWVVNPGIRWAHDFESGLQIVPGLAYTVNLERAGDPDSIFLYLSFEYPFSRTR